MQQNLDDSLPGLNPTRSPHGTVRYLGDDDHNTVETLNRVFGDLAHRDNLLAERLLEIEATIQGTQVDPENIAMPVSPQNPTNKAYVDRQDAAIARGVAIIGERLKTLRAFTTMTSGWVQVPWKEQTAKERIDLVLSTADGEPVQGLDFNQVSGVVLFLRAEITDGSTTRYIYRVISPGATTGFKFDDIWITPPGTVSILVPYVSNFPAYPPSAGYRMTQPSSIAVKAVLTSTQAVSVSGSSEIPTLGTSDPEIEAIVNLTIAALAKVSDPKLTLSPVAGFGNAVVALGDSIRKASDVHVGNQAIRLAKPLSKPARILGLSSQGDTVLASGIDGTTATGTRNVLVDANGFVLFSEPTTPQYVAEVGRNPNGEYPIAYKAIEYGTPEIPVSRMDEISIGLSRFSPPDWATQVKLRIVLGCHTSGNGLTPLPHFIRVFAGHGHILTSERFLCQAILNFDFGGGVRFHGMENSPYFVQSEANVWVPITSGSILLSILHKLHIKTDGKIPYNLVAASLTHFGR